MDSNIKHKTCSSHSFLNLTRWQPPHSICLGQKCKSWYASYYFSNPKFEHLSYSLHSSHTSNHCYPLNMMFPGQLPLQVVCLYSYLSLDSSSSREPSGSSSHLKTWVRHVNSLAQHSPFPCPDWFSTAPIAIKYASTLFFCLSLCGR